MKYLGLLCLLLFAFFLTEEYRRFRQRRRAQLDALLRYLVAIRDGVSVYRVAKMPTDLSSYEALCRIGLTHAENAVTALSPTLAHMAISKEEREKLEEFLKSFGDGNVETEQHKLKKIIENVKMILQKEEKEGKKSVETVRIVVFVAVLSFVIILL